MHEIGVYGKQTSCYFQALGQENRVEDNLCYNGPRAGINWNDGFAGGSTVSGNLVFNQVRETGDHGPYNSWDRQPYLTHSGNPDGFPPTMKNGMGDNVSILKMPDAVHANFFINGCAEILFYPFDINILSLVYVSRSVHLNLCLFPSFIFTLCIDFTIDVAMRYNTTIEPLQALSMPTRSCHDNLHPYSPPR